VPGTQRKFTDGGDTLMDMDSNIFEILDALADYIEHFIDVFSGFFFRCFGHSIPCESL
jgi:hypothetical protein